MVLSAGTRQERRQKHDSETPTCAKKRVGSAGRKVKKRVKVNVRGEPYYGQKLGGRGGSRANSAEVQQSTEGKGRVQRAAGRAVGEEFV
jgi:hypothetical protein